MVGVVVAKVFISFAGANLDWADKIHGWLREAGHEAFLDRDKNDGIAPGDEWQSAIFEKLRWADAVMCASSGAIGFPRTRTSRTERCVQASRPRPAE